MVPLAIVVILIVIVFTVALVLAPDPATLSIFGAQINANTTGVYFTGAVTMLVLLVSLLLLRHGISRSVRRRKEVQTLKKRAEVGNGSAAEQDHGQPNEKPKADRRSKGDKRSKGDSRSTGERAATRKGHRADPGSEAAAAPTSDRPTSDRPTSDRPTSEEGTSTSSERQSLLDETDSLLGDERDR